MDNKKIGKLIATLRNKEGLTQQDLGDKIGVGFRAVSKWERGINLPDIGNMTELSKIFGITLDELMAGELKTVEEETKVKKKISPKIKITISIITSIIIIFTSIFIYTTTKTYTYDMVCTNSDECHIKGKVSFENNKISILVNELGFLDEQINSIKVKNYEYKVYSNDLIIFAYGYTPTGNHLEKAKTIGEIANTFRINYTDTISVPRKEIIENKLLLIINFLDENNKEITKKIELSLGKSSDK